MKYLMTVALALFQVGCIFASDSPKLGNEFAADVSWDMCGDTARSVKLLPDPGNDKQKIHDSSVFGVFSSKDSGEGRTDSGDGRTRLHVAAWAHALDDDGGRTVFVQVQGFKKESGMNRWILYRLQTASFGTSNENEEVVTVFPTGDIKLVENQTVSDQSDQEVQMTLVVVTNQRSLECAFLVNPMMGSATACKATDLEDSLSYLGLWPLKRVFVGMQRPATPTTNAAVYLGFEGGQPVTLAATQFIGSNNGNNVPPMNFLQSVGPLLPASSSAGGFLWGLDRDDGQPYLTAILKDEEDTTLWGYVSPSPDGFDFSQGATAPLPTTLRLGHRRVALANSFTIGTSNANGFSSLEARDPRFGYLGIANDDGGLIMGTMDDEVTYAFEMPEPTKVSAVLSGRDLSFSGNASTEVPATFFILWGDQGNSKLAAGRTMFDGKARFADSIMGANVDEIQDFYVDEMSQGQAMVIAKVRRGTTLELRISQVNLDPANSDFCNVQ